MFHSSVLREQERHTHTDTERERYRTVLQSRGLRMAGWSKCLSIRPQVRKQLHTKRHIKNKCLLLERFCVSWDKCGSFHVPCLNIKTNIIKRYTRLFHFQTPVLTKKEWTWTYRFFVGKKLFPDPEEVLAKLSQAFNEAFLEMNIEERHKENDNNNIS